MWRILSSFFRSFLRQTNSNDLENMACILGEQEAKEKERERGGATRAKTKICIDEEIAEVARRRSQGVLWICVICIQWKRLRSNDIWSIFCFAHLPLFLFMYFYLIHNGTWVCAVNFYLLTNKQTNSCCLVSVYQIFILFWFPSFFQTVWTAM